MQRLAGLVLCAAMLAFGCTSKGSGADPETDGGPDLATAEDSVIVADVPAPVDEGIPTADGTAGDTTATAVDLPAPADPSTKPDPSSDLVPGPWTSSALAGLVAQVDLQVHLEAVAKPRPPGSAHWQTVQDRCADAFAALGYTVERQDYGSGVNVIGTRPGSDPAAGTVVVSAHYDSVAACDGADDNASGVAGVLVAAKVLANASYRGTLVVACWDEEEDGLIGSKAWVGAQDVAGTKIRAAFVFEMIGYCSSEPDSQTLPQGIDIVFPDQAAQIAENGNKGDFLAIVADDLSHDAAAAITLHAKDRGLPTVWLELVGDFKNSSLVGDLRRSDHAPFWTADLPAMMLTDTSEFRNRHYHCHDGEDALDTLDLAFATKVVAATVGAAADTLGIVM